MVSLGWVAAAIVLVLTLVVAAAVLGLGWLAYQARLARERREFAPAVTLPDPVDDLVRVNGRIREVMAEARTTATAIEHTVRHGVRG